MVEGPGATRNGRKVQAAIGLVVQSVEASTFSAERLVSRTFTNAFSVGKELFLIFSPLDDDNDGKKVALRLHFGMNGCLYILNKKINNTIPPWRRSKQASLRITFVHSMEETMILETQDSTSNMVSTLVAHSKFNRLHIRDACSPSFNLESVCEAIITKRPNAMICDALLDQERFPGVGNIIKIEGLHQACMNPQRIVNSLQKQELHRVISECRAYSLKWLQSGKAPTKAVYNRTICGTCRNSNVRMVKLGQDMSRTTFWCSSCQPLTIVGVLDNNKENTQQATNMNNSMLLTQQNNHTGKAGTPYCPQHGSKAILLRRVRKPQNQYRLFRICKVRSCQYFNWADAHLPSCHCPSSKSVLRVSKTQRTGGQWFLSCATRKCKFFEWTTPKHLAPFGRSLTPLL